MKFEGEYQPSSAEYARDQVAQYEASGGKRANVAPGTAFPVVIITYRGVKSGKVRKTPLMRVESGGAYALVASNAGSAVHPAWYCSILADSRILIQDGPEPLPFSARELDAEEYDEWWVRAVGAYPTYAEYGAGTARPIPVLLAEPAAG